MFTLKYEDFMKKVPGDTARYVRQLLYYLPSYLSGSKLGSYIFYEADKILYKSLRAYQMYDKNGKNLLNLLGFNDDSYLESDDSSLEDTFSNYYKYIVPCKKEEDIYLLTPEDIINNIYNKASYLKDDCKTLRLINNGYSDDYLFKELKKVSINKKNEIIEKLNNEYFVNCPISVINYYKSVGKIYTYLNDNKDKIKTIVPSEDNIRALSYLLGLFYYENVATNIDIFNEKEIILKYFKKIGLTKEKLESIIGIDLSKIDSEASIIVLKSKLNLDYIKTISNDNKYVGYIFNGILHKETKDNLSYKNILGLCNLTVFQLGSFYNYLDEQKKELNNTSVEEMYKNLIPETNLFLHRICKIYTYLINENNINKTYISSEEDYKVLSLLIENYLNRETLSVYLSENGLTFDKLLELLNLPKKEDLILNINNNIKKKKNITKFKSLLFYGYCSSKPNNQVTTDLIYKNLLCKDYSNDLIARIFNSVTGINLQSNYSDQVSNYFIQKDNERKEQIKEELFKDVNIDVYNYLCIVYNYYMVLGDKGLSDEDREQLSIIFAACAHDERLNDYLDSIGFKRNVLSDSYNLKVRYDKYDMNIDVIKCFFSKYIFDRDKDKITVHSIFENAFEPKLNNSVKLRQALFKMGKEPEDFLDIDKKLEQYDIELKHKELNDRVVKEFDRIKSEAKNITIQTIKIYEYLKNNNKNELLNNDSDYKEMAMLIAILNNNNEYIQFFNNYNITLDYVLSLIGLNESDLDTILNNKCNDKLILEFSDYYSQASYIYVSSYIHYIFDDESRIMKKIIKTLKNDFNEVKDSVLNKKEKKITPIEGINMLSKEEILPIKDKNISSLAIYGESLSKHSKYINDSLKELMFKDTIDKSIKDINLALGEVVEEKRVPVEQSFWESMFSTKPSVKVVKKYNPEKLGDLQESIDNQLISLTKELQGYEFIKEYIELYLIKLEEELKELKNNYDSLDYNTYNLDDISDYTKALDNKTKQEILKSKISTIETMKVLMKQELLSVHRAIINHFVTINSLHTSKNAILPVLASEMAINKGNKSEGDALELTNSLLGLLQSVVNKNVLLTEQNLEKLKLSSLSGKSFEILDKEINLYLKDINRSNKILEEPKEKSYVEKIAEDTGLTLKEDNVPNLTLEEKN